MDELELRGGSGLKSRAILIPSALLHHKDVHTGCLWIIYSQIKLIQLLLSCLFSLYRQL